MKLFLKHLTFSAALAVSASSVVAQESNWNFAATMYLFMPETNIASGGIEATLSFSDALENLDMAFMGAFEANNGRWGLLGDFMLTDLEFSNNTPGLAYSGLNTTMKTQFFNGYVLYSAYQAPTVKLDVAAGLRWFDTSSELDLVSGLLPGRTSSANDSWVDPVVGVRAQFEISDKWSGTVFADYGGFSSDSETWQVLLTADYNISERWSLRFGYRHISVDHDIGGSAFKLDQSGPMIGATYRF
ncbi:hypothetical protein SAMN05444000_1201 [Shimia gijangensis]|uniref:Outer membrane protein beta-barrel domain-containing protein n=1 Tax=Shimia gijangensis TaxID=1470563 RepID=A0A1M6Q0I2_9RHOB|nr:hypothetical protein [Shimia gijangensis]SHK13673.1 hypothetical protein SAMN05444000_1201 [Shimia gijangensis]